MKKTNTANLNLLLQNDRKTVKPPILVVCEPPGEQTFSQGGVMSQFHLSRFNRMCNNCGIPLSMLEFITPCPPVPEAITKREKKVLEYLSQYRGEFITALNRLLPGKRLVVFLGKNALRQFAGKNVSIKELRGSFERIDPKLMAVPASLRTIAIYGPGHFTRSPEVLPVVEADMRQIGNLIKNNWDYSCFRSSIESGEYTWCRDLSPLLENPPKFIGLDTETRGLDYAMGRKAILTVQITVKDGKSLVIPLDPDFYNDRALRDETVDYGEDLTADEVSGIIGQLKQLFSNPGIKVFGHNLKFDLHHLKNYGIEVANWFADTMQLSYVVDDNMQERNLDECTRRWVKPMAGYADEFNKKVDKSHMETVHHREFLRYAGGDTDAVFRLYRELVILAKQDRRNWNCFLRVQMPALRAFLKMEHVGMNVDQQSLRSLGDELDVMDAELEQELSETVKRDIPEAVKELFAEGKPLDFNSSKCVSHLLFSRSGYGLAPKVFTQGSTKDAPVPSVSIKTHLPFFSDSCPFVARYIEYKQLQMLRNTYVGKPRQSKETPILRLKNGSYPAVYKKALEEMDAQIMAKVPAFTRTRDAGGECPPNGRTVLAQATIPKGIVTLYRGGQATITTEQPPSGFWQNICADGSIHATFRLDKTVTGRSSCQNPNLQNIPKRGRLAKMFRRVFTARPGKVIIECDLSQAELRIAAWMANERHMIELYRNGVDIHAATAAKAAQMTLEQFQALPHDQYKKLRQNGKPVNFGFLYGMGWDKFMRFARTDYGVTFTPEEAQNMRKHFFEAYPALQVWHKNMRAFVRKHGYVRALHGSLRRLPGIYSTDEAVVAECERQAINSPVQKFASDIGLMALAEFSKHDTPDYYGISFIHDANYIEVNAEAAYEVTGWLKWQMQNIPFYDWFGLEPPLPIIADAAVGPSLDKTEEQENQEVIVPPWAK